MRLKLWKRAHMAVNTKNIEVHVEAHVGGHYLQLWMQGVPLPFSLTGEYRNR